MGVHPKRDICSSVQAGMHWDSRTPGFSQHNVTQMDPTAPRGPVSVQNHVRAKLLQSCPTLCDPRDCSPPGSSVHGDSPGNNTGVGCHALLQGIFQTQGSNWCLLNVSCIGRQALYHLRSPVKTHILPQIPFLWPPLQPFCVCSHLGPQFTVCFLPQPVSQFSLHLPVIRIL